MLSKLLELYKSDNEIVDHIFIEQNLENETVQNIPFTEE